VFQKAQKLYVGAVALCCVVGGCAIEPVPLTPEARTEQTITDLKQIKAMEYVPNGPITLHQAMARAVTFNLQRRVKEIEREIDAAPAEIPHSLSAIATASGGPAQQRAVPLLEGGGSGLRDGGDGEVSLEQEALIASHQAKQKFVVQLAVFRSESKARQFRRSVTEPEEATLHGVDVRVAERPASKGETLHYVETATVADWATARDLCATLKSFGQNCIPATR
jgi:hypothetical protein